MSENQSDRPNWLDESLDNIKQIRENIDPIRQEGRREIRRGLEKLRKTNELTQELSYVEQTLGQDSISSGLWDDEIVTASGIHLAKTLNRYAESTNHLRGLVSRGSAFGGERHEEFMRAYTNTSIQSGTAAYLSAGIERRFETVESEYQPLLTIKPPERLASREKLLNKLRKQLSKYESKFVSMLDGSESALEQDGPDHLSQASHSMRDLFQQLIESLAPTKAVKMQPWYEPVAGPPGGVSRRQRLRYMLYGSGIGIDSEILEELDETANEAKDALDLAIARAHDHDPNLSLEEVKLAIDLARFSLSEVLKIYEGHRTEK
jgi:hypothetical protein